MRATIGTWLYVSLCQLVSQSVSPCILFSKLILGIFQGTEISSCMYSKVKIANVSPPDKRHFMLCHQRKDSMCHLDNLRNEDNLQNEDSLQSEEDVIPSSSLNDPSRPY